MGFDDEIFSRIDFKLSSFFSALEGNNPIDKFESSTIYEENKKKIELIRQEMNKREEKPFVQKTSIGNRLEKKIENQQDVSKRLDKMLADF